MALLLCILFLFCLYCCKGNRDPEVMNIRLFNKLRPHSRKVSHYTQLIRDKNKNEDSFIEDQRNLQNKNNVEKLKKFPKKVEPIKFDKKKISLKSDNPTHYPSQNSSGVPSYSPIQKTNVPSIAPTFRDVKRPSSTPSLSTPVESPNYRIPTTTDNPTNKPTSLRSSLPSNEPTVYRTELTFKKTTIPSSNPTIHFSSHKQTHIPTIAPTTKEPTISIINNPSLLPTINTNDETSEIIHAKYSAIIGIRLNRRQLDILNTENNIGHRIDNGIQNSKIMLLNSQTAILSNANEFLQKILNSTVETICKELLKQKDLEFPFILATVNSLSSELVVQCATSQEYKENIPLPNYHNVNRDTTIMFIDEPSKSIKLMDRAQQWDSQNSKKYCETNTCEFDYMEISTQISIQRIGSKISSISDQSSRDIGEDFETCCKTESALQIEKNVNDAITNGIEDGSLQKLMNVKYKWVVEASPLDQEINIFPDFLSNLNEIILIDDSHGIKTLIDDNVAATEKQKHKYPETLKVNSIFDRGIREFGLFLFLSTLTLSSLITLIGRQKRIFSEKEIKRISSSLGGLTTEEGVELMLEKGSFDKISNASFE